MDDNIYKSEALESKCKTRTWIFVECQMSFHLLFFSLRKNSNIKHCLTFLLGYVVYVSKWTYIKKYHWSACLPCPTCHHLYFHAEWQANESLSAWNPWGHVNESDTSSVQIIVLVSFFSKAKLFYIQNRSVGPSFQVYARS